MSHLCQATTKTGRPCKAWEVRPGEPCENGIVHPGEPCENGTVAGAAKPMSRHCTSLTKTGRPCKAWAVSGSDPPRCSAHGGCAASRSCNPEPVEGAAERKPRPVGAPPNNKNAAKHGFYSNTARQRKCSPPAPGAIRSIDDAIAHLAHSLIQLAHYIHDHAGEFTVEEMVRLQSVFGQNLSRYIRAQRDHAAGGHDAELQADIDQALQLAGEVLGVDLSHT